MRKQVHYIEPFWPITPWGKYQDYIHRIRLPMNHKRVKITIEEVNGKKTKKS